MATIDRRTILKIGAGVALSLTPTTSLFSKESGLENPLHITIANQARRLASGKNPTLKLLYPNGSLGNINPLVSEFERLTGIKIEIQEGSLDEISAELILQQKLKSESFDVAIPNTYGLPDLVESDSILDLTEFAEQYQPSSYEPSLYTLGDSYRGRLYGYQTDGDCYMMFYNGRMLNDERYQKLYSDMYGSPLTIPTTWDELDRQMAFFHKPGQQQYGGSLYRNQNYTAWEFWVRFHAMGYFPFSESMHCQLNTDAGLAALENLRNATAYLEPGVFTNDLFENFDSFAKGDTYCNIGWGGTQKTLNGPNSKIKDNLVYAPLPGGNLATPEPWLPYFNWGWNFVVPKDTNYPEIAYLFCLFSVTPVPSTLSVRDSGGYFDPYRSEHYADEEIRKTYSGEFLNVHQYSMEHAFPDLYIRGRGLYFDVLKQGVFASGSGLADAEVMLNQIAAKWDELTDDLGHSAQQSQWAFLRDNYPRDIAQALI